MQPVMLNHYVNEFRTYLYFSKRVLQRILLIRVNNAVTLPHSAQRKHEFLGKIKEMSKKRKLPARKKMALELLHQRLGHRYTISLLAGDADNVWERCRYKNRYRSSLHIM